MLSFLDGYDLRNTLLVNKKWYDLGTNQQLSKITNREQILKVKEIDSTDHFNFMLKIFDKDANLKFFLKITKEYGKDRVFKSTSIVFSLLNFFNFSPFFFYYLSIIGDISSPHFYFSLFFSIHSLLKLVSILLGFQSMIIKYSSFPFPVLSLVDNKDKYFYY